MRPLHTLSVVSLSVFAFLSLVPARASAQANNARPRISQAVDEARTTVLRGNTHPFARPEFDRGAVPGDLLMERMMLVLKRSPEQEAALGRLMAEQQDKSSPNFHKWLTPVQFGQEFGPADQDIQRITSWLESHGFQVAPVSNGRTVIEFSGTAAQVQEAFHAPIHNFVVNGESHWANVSDPSIPTALAPVVAGVNTLHNFFPKPMSHVASASSRRLTALDSSSPRPQVTFSSSIPCGLTSVSTCFGLGPTDFATIYNVLPLWNAGIDGTGVTIAIVADSNIDVRDVRDFRSIFGLPAKDPIVTVNGADPGRLAGGNEVEAALDVEWAGAVARNADINLVASKDAASAGVDLSAKFIVNEASPPAILSESFGACELSLGTAGNAFYRDLWSQAAAEGITVLVSSGDQGSAGCDFVQGNASLQPAQSGLAVNGIASTPSNVAVGGTEFNDVANPAPFWNPTSAAGTFASAIKYIPEMTYNDSCTSTAVINFFSKPSAVAACNDPAVQNFLANFNSTSPNPGFVVTLGGSGGLSDCTSSAGNDPSTCTGGYAKPTWQQGGATPNDGKRDLPDVSMFAGDGTISGSFYVVCNRDFPNNGNAPCTLTGNSPVFLGAGGTSVSAQVFAGIVALIDQKYADKQGLINPALYTLAAGSGNTCASTANPATTCVFYDVTTDTIAMPCKQAKPDCAVNTAIGVLPGYDAGAGYDLATGLGSVNAANLVNAAGFASTTGGNDFSLSLSSPTVTVARGSTNTVTLNVVANGIYNGTINFTPASCSALPSESTCSFNPASITGSGSTVITIAATAPSMLTPLSRPDRIGLPGTGTTVAVAAAFCICLLMFSFLERKRRWGAVLALTVIAVATVSVGCSGGSGGGGGGGGNPGTPTGTTAIVVTATSGTIHRSIAANLTVN